MVPNLAARLAELVLANLDREWPYKPGYALAGPGDLRRPRELTPIFYGCFDWHSAVHSHWALARLARAFPEAPWAGVAARTLADRLSPAAIDREADFLAARPGFELPYGIAWLLALTGELERHPGLAGRAGRLAAVGAEHMTRWLERLTTPIRSGQHDQSAFAMGLSRDWAVAAGHTELAALVDARARELYLGDRAAPIAYEPSAHDFLSPALAEAELMARLLPPAELAPWLAAFLPSPSLKPVTTIDPADGKLAHASGLNLSRAWMARRIATSLPPGPQQASFDACASLHEAAAWQPAAEPPYAESHWVPTFVVYQRLSAIS